MPNGKPGDHPYTDIVAHNVTVYSRLSADLVREIARLGDDKTCRALGDLLLEKYNPHNHPNIGELERYLLALRDRLKRDGISRGFEGDSK